MYAPIGACTSSRSSIVCGTGKYMPPLKYNTCVPVFFFLQGQLPLRRLRKGRRCGRACWLLLSNSDQVCLHLINTACAIGWILLANLWTLQKRFGKSSIWSVAIVLCWPKMFVLADHIFIYVWAVSAQCILRVGWLKIINLVILINLVVGWSSF
jgi:hypothetical protein